MPSIISAPQHPCIGGGDRRCRGLIRGGEKDVASGQSLSLKLSAIVSTSAAALRFRRAEALLFAPISDASSATPSITSIALCFAITPSSTSKWIRLSHSIRAISHWGSEDCITASLFDPAIGDRTPSDDHYFGNLRPKPPFGNPLSFLAQ